MGHCILDPGQTREVLLHLYNKRKYSVRRLARMLGVGKSTVHRVLKGEQEPPPIVRARLCEILSEDELMEILRGEQLLRRYGLLDGEGRLNRALALALIDAIMQNDVAREEVLDYLLKYYKQQLMERLSRALPKLMLKWTGGFEDWLTARKQRPISERTLKDYRNLWYRCLEGKTLGWHLLKQLGGKEMQCRDGQYHPTGWARQIFRHYIRYLYSIGRLDWDAYTRLLLVVPGRKYGRRVSQKVIREEEVVLTLRTLDEKGRGDILTLYLLILASGIRFMHVLEAMNNWRPDEELYVPYLNRNVKRLECGEEICRYYLGKEDQVKPAAFMYFPRVLLPLINTFAGKLPGRRRIEKVTKKWGCLAPKYARIFALREMKRVIGDNDVYRFIVGKFGELTVSARHYMDLLEEADKVYPKYVERWLEIVDKPLSLNMRQMNS